MASNTVCAEGHFVIKDGQRAAFDTMMEAMIPLTQEHAPTLSYNYYMLGNQVIFRHEHENAAALAEALTNVWAPHIPTLKELTDQLRTECVGPAEGMGELEELIKQWGAKGYVTTHEVNHGNGTDHPNQHEVRVTMVVRDGQTAAFAEFCEQQRAAVADQVRARSRCVRPCLTCSRDRRASSP